jgi:hypothetical protein
MTVPMLLPFRKVISVLVGILGDQLLGPVVLPNKVTGTVH